MRMERTSKAQNELLLCYFHAENAKKVEMDSGVRSVFRTLLWITTEEWAIFLRLLHLFFNALGKGEITRCEVISQHFCHTLTGNELAHKGSFGYPWGQSPRDNQNFTSVLTTFLSQRHKVSFTIFRLWFHFTVENTQKDQRVIFNVVNLSKWRTLFAEGLTPVVKSTSRPRWQRHSGLFCLFPAHFKPKMTIF